MQEAEREESLLAEKFWRSALEDLENTLSEVGKALGVLRNALERGEARETAPQPLRLVGAEEVEDTAPVAEAGLEAAPADEQTDNAADGPEDDSQPTNFQSVWERFQRQREGLSEDGTATPPEPAVDIDEPAMDAGTDDGEPPASVVSIDERTDDGSDRAEDDSRSTSFQNVWERLQRERKGLAEDGTATPPEPAVDVQEAAIDAGGDDGEPPAEAMSAEEPTDNLADRAGGESRPGNFQNVWERLQREREERSAAPVEEVADVRGLGNLPQSYRITIEDRDGTPVDLVPVHRALLAFASADDVSLVNFANGTAVISMRTKEKLDLDQLSSVIGAATLRECEVIEQAQGKLFLRLSLEEDAEQGSDG